MGAYYYDNSDSTDAGYVSDRVSSGMQGLGFHHHHHGGHGSNWGGGSWGYGYPYMIEPFPYITAPLDWQSICANPLTAKDYPGQCIESAAQEQALSGYLGAAAKTAQLTAAEKKALLAKPDVNVYWLLGSIAVAVGIMAIVFSRK
jgi:hypothetical protein